MKDIKVTLFMAMSLNGVVARENHSEDFLPHYGWEKFVELVKEAGGFIVGRRTYSLVRENYDGFGFDFISDNKKIVITSRNDFGHESDILIANSIENSLQIAKDQGLKEVILSGGPSINTQFAKLGLIDEIVFNVEPVVIGKGISVFNPTEFDLALEPVSMKKHKDNGYTLVYKVRNQI